jgi:hypothetical protein
MAKIDISKAVEVIKKNEPDAAVARRMIEELNLILSEQEGDEEKAPAVKKQFVVLVSDPRGALDTSDFVAWVLQIPETESVATTQDRILRSAYDFNVTKKGRLLPVKTIGEALENVPSRFFKEADVWVKTKTPVLVLKTDNQIPRDNSAKAA